MFSEKQKKRSVPLVEAFRTSRSMEGTLRGFRLSVRRKMEQLHSSLRGGMGAGVDGKSTFESVQMAPKWMSVAVLSFAETLICVPYSSAEILLVVGHADLDRSGFPNRDSSDASSYRKLNLRPTT
jgi:hypothetical protein